ncbi:MAG: hypothetical protein QOG45_1999 [Chloroflexota bacterium]|jgi:hypothetical protein|nr:hypothetical protein [Chloroflexota bacterium]
MQRTHIRTRRLRLLLAAAGGAAMALAAVGSASAHEHRTVGQGAYSMVVGWRGEPTYTGGLNAVQLFVRDAQDKPVTDLGADSLKVQVVYQGQKSDVLALEAAFGATYGTPGEYNAALQPTRPGDYTFHFTGAIHGTTIDESFTSSPKTFSAVKDDTSIEFPVKDPGRGDLSTAVQRLGDRVAPMPARITAAQSSAQSAADAGNRATVIAVIALVLAVLAGGGLGMLLRVRGAAAARTADS